MEQAETSSTSTHPLVESDRVEGTAVYDVSRRRIGTIKRLVIEKTSGQVVYAITTMSGFLGGNSEMHSIPWDQLHYDTALHGYHTSITEQQLREAPEFSRGNEKLLSQRDWEELGEYYAGPA